MNLTAGWKDPAPPTPPRGARLANPQAAAHPSYSSQSLFSIYVHTDPAYDGFHPGSLFHGREITPQIEGHRYSHSLSRILLLLLEAALNDPQVGPPFSRPFCRQPPLWTCSPSGGSPPEAVLWSMVPLQVRNATRCLYSFVPGLDVVVFNGCSE